MDSSTVYLVAVVVPEVAVGGGDVVGEDGPVLAAVELLCIAVEGIRTLGKIPAFLFGTEDGLFLHPSVIFVEVSRFDGLTGCESVDTIHDPCTVDGEAYTSSTLIK